MFSLRISIINLNGTRRAAGDVLALCGYARKCSIVNFSENVDGQFALCLLDSRQFRAEPISSRGDHAVPTKLIDIQKLSISPP